MAEGGVGNLCCGLANIMRSSKNEALAISVPTSPRPYHGDGMRMDWPNGSPFVRQQAPRVSIRILCRSSFPAPAQGRDPAVSVRVRESDAMG